MFKAFITHQKGFTTKYAVFLCSDTVSIIERVANVTPAQSNTEYHLIIVPKISVISKKLLREKTGYNSLYSLAHAQWQSQYCLSRFQGCYNDQTDKPGKIASIIPCFVELFMLNSSLITLNIVNSYRKLIDRDQCLPSTTARALMTFQVFNFSKTASLKSRLLLAFFRKFLLVEKHPARLWSFFLAREKSSFLAKIKSLLLSFPVWFWSTEVQT